jgi:hypothetical protein
VLGLGSCYGLRMTKYTVLVDNRNDTIAVGPFPDADTAARWADENELAGNGTCVGVVQLVTRAKFKG